MSETGPRRRGKPVRIGGEPGSQLGVARVLQGRQVCGQEIHLLRQSPLDDFVVLIETEADGLPVEDFLTHPLLDQCIHFLRSRHCTALRQPDHRQLAQIVLGQHDLVRLGNPAGRRSHELVEPEDQPANGKEMEERLAQPLPNQI